MLYNLFARAKNLPTPPKENPTLYLCPNVSCTRVGLELYLTLHPIIMGEGTGPNVLCTRVGLELNLTLHPIIMGEGTVEL